MWKKKNNIKNSYLLLHTYFKEGWNIHKLADEYGIDKREILTTYICKKCANYEVKAHTREDQECRFCGDNTSMVTTGVSCGVTEEQ